jgi:hypothetical protein
MRVALGIPVRVSGHESDNSTWSEISRSNDVCCSGASFSLRRPVKLGEVLYLSLPLPQRFRQFDLTDASYRVYAVVRNIGGAGADGARVGVMFLGKHAPAGYGKGVRLLMPNDEVKPRNPRYEVRVGVRLRRLDAPGEERTVTENLGTGGALVLTTLPIAKGESVDVETEDGLLDARCSVQNVAIGKDNVPRLSLMFLDPEAEAGARAVLRRNGFLEADPAGPPRDAPKPAPQPASPSTSVRFERREAFPECSQDKHGGCVGWSWDSVPRTLRLCRCTCHGV